MKNIYLFLLAVIISESGTSQISFSFPGAKDSVRWYIQEEYFIGSRRYKIEYCGTEHVCGHEYSCLFKEDSICMAMVRIDGERVYGRKSKECADKEYLLYDFSLELGEELYIGNSLLSPIGPDTTLVRMVEIDSIELVNQRAERLKLLYDRCNQDELYDTLYWIRGVGNTLNPFFSFKCFCDICEVISSTVCMQIANKTEYALWEGSCTINVSTREEGSEEEGIQVRPNPFNTRTFIEGPKGVKILDVKTIAGNSLVYESRRVDDHTIEMTLIDGFYKGIVLIVVENDGEKRVIKATTK